jgi:Chaperone of endosialidase
VDNDGKLGVFLSARRFKTDIADMGAASKALLALRPVTFHYKPELDKTGIPQFGLVAEEVAKVNPDLVTHDAKGDIYTVRYEAVNAMLLNEFLKEHRKVQEQDRELHEQAATIAQLKSTVAQQQKGMEAVVAHVKEQDKKMQRVTDQIELSKPAPQTVVNSQ